MFYFISVNITYFIISYVIKLQIISLLGSIPTNIVILSVHIDDFITTEKSDMLHGKTVSFAALYY